ncbi:MAG: LamG domain-containing protein, partial [Pirellulales bacterium]
YGIHLVDGKLQVNLVKRWLDDAIRVETQTVLSPGDWQHVLVTYDGSRVATGVRVYVNGEPQPMRVLLDDLNQSFQTKQPLRIGGGAGPAGRFHGRLDEVRIYNAALPAEQAEVLATAETVTAIAGIPPDERTAGQSRKIREYYLEHHATAEARQARRRVAELQVERKRLVESFPTVMVMEEMPTPRETHVL